MNNCVKPEGHKFVAVVYATETIRGGYDTVVTTEHVKIFCEHCGEVKGLPDNK